MDEHVARKEAAKSNTREVGFDFDGPYLGPWTWARSGSKHRGGKRMKFTRIVLMAVGLLCGASSYASADGTVDFTLTDIPGHWFDTDTSIAGTRSLGIGTSAGSGVTVNFHQHVESRHTVTSLIWPTGGEQIDQNEANTDDHSVTLTVPGLYVFVCKLHPYMLGGVIVNDTGTAGLDIGDELNLLGVGPFPSHTNLGHRLLRAFFVVTNPGNWKDYRRVGSTYQVDYPSVDVRVHDGTNPAVANLKTVLQSVFPGETIPALQKPTTKGVGEVWIDTAYELSFEKGASYPGSMTVVNVGGSNPWKVKRKIALPDRLMNNGHNMWASHNQNIIYQTEWHGTSLFILNRVTGKMLREIEIGADPAHVMTRVDTEQVHATLNGEDYVVELNKAPAPEYLRINRYISMRLNPNVGNPTQPHAHWMGHDGKSMATPNANTGDSTLYAFNPNDPNTGSVTSQNATGALPIAAAMTPDGKKYYVSNYLSHTTSVMCGPSSLTAPVVLGCVNPGDKITDINLLQNYDVASGVVSGNGAVGALPIQTPVSPDGKFVVTGNTLTGTITIIETATDTLVKSLACDPGCHGVNWGAKKGGGYYAYVTSKFANRLIVYDIDPNNDGSASDAIEAGSVLLADDTAPRDSWILDNLGQGGQGVLPVPNVYNGWVQKLPASWKLQLTAGQRNPFPIP